MKTRLVAAITATTEPPRVPHYIGLPSELSQEAEPELLPWARILLLEERPDGVFLFRYTSNRSYAGDTWHASVEQAQAQAAYEYADHLGVWQPVPDDVKDALTFARVQG